MQMSEDSMAFPNTWEEFEKNYGFNDVEEIYTNGSRLIQSFRVKQWLEHLDARPVRYGKWRETYLDHEAFGERPSIFYCSACCACSVVKTNYCPNCGARMDEK